MKNFQATFSSCLSCHSLKMPSESGSRRRRQRVAVKACTCARVRSASGKIMIGERRRVTRWRGTSLIFGASGWAAVRDFFPLIPSSGLPPPLPQPAAALFKQKTKVPRVVLFFPQSHAAASAFPASVSAASGEESSVTRGDFKRANP